MALVTPNASRSTAVGAGHLFKAYPQAFPLNSVSFHAEWLPHGMSRAGVRHPSLHSAACSLSLLEPRLLHHIYSHPRASQGLPGPWCAQEGLLQLFGGPPCASTMQSGIALQPFLYSLSLPYVGLLKPLGGLEFALCSL